MAFAATDDFAISLDFFSGPMDLLLHLVHQQEVAIQEVSMRLIAEQYLQVISQARFLDLEKASEYLVIAATLMSIKSASLLPVVSQEQQEEPAEELGEKFYEELRAKLQAYELTKVRAKALIDLPQLGVDVYSRVDRKALLPTPEMLAEPEEASSLALLFGQLIRRIGKSAALYTIRADSISVVSYMMRIVDSFTPGKSGSEDSAEGPRQTAVTASERKSFRTLVQSYLRCMKPASSSASAEALDKAAAGQRRGVVIGSFIAVLELVKRGLLSAAQREDGSDIEIALRMTADDPQITAAEATTFESEFDGESALADSGEETPAENKIVDFQRYKQGKRRITQAEEPQFKEVSNRGS
jgi:segregation and condensation protein A